MASNDDLWIGLPGDGSAWSGVREEADRLRGRDDQPARMPERPFTPFTPWYENGLIGVDETLTNKREDREFRNEVLGEFRAPSTGHVFSYLSHVADATLYAHAQSTSWPRSRLHRSTHPTHYRNNKSQLSPSRFYLVSPAVASELEPDAMVPYDRDLAGTISNPVFLTQWGHLYVASLDSHHVCWCWNGQGWDDISDGIWAEPHERAWMDSLSKARVRIGLSARLP